MARRGRRDRWPRYERSSRLEAEGGIRAKSRRGDIGESWWSRRFVEVLESLGMGARMGRGKSYARSGQVMDLSVETGEVTARVQGSRRAPYGVSLRLKPFDGEQWEAVTEALGAEAIYAAQLLAGQMPDEVEDAFQSAGLSLFPEEPEELTTSCSCPDWANPCKHVAATLYILAERFDSDPWAIFAWRGCHREALLDGLRARRGRVADGDAPPEPEPQVQALTDPRSFADAASWFAGPRGALDEAQRQVAAASQERTAAPIRELLGPAGIEVDGEDLGEVLGVAWGAEVDGG